MKKLTCILIGCSLALAGAALAQKPDEHASPHPSAAAEKGKGHASEAKPKTHAAEPKPAAASTKSATAPAETHAEKHGGKSNAAPTMEKAAPSESTQLKAPTGPATTTAPAVDKQAAKVAKEEKQKATDAVKATPEPKATAAAKNMPEPKATATAKPTATVNAKATPTPRMSATPAPTASAAASVTAPTPPAPVPSATAAASPVTTASVSGGSAQAATPNPAAPKKPEPQKIQQIQTQQASFRAQPRPDRVPPVTFQANYRIQNVDTWQGPQYEVYRSYRPERHDRDYYHSRYRRVELIAGGYYYWNAGYWYPAWGYSPREEYYAYDAPIYVGQRAEPPDRVISEVQAVLKDMGYYKGEVDGLLGPLTREALVGYQTDQGLTRTAVMDEPTLNSLGMS